MRLSRLNVNNRSGYLVRVIMLSIDNEHDFKKHVTHGCFKNSNTGLMGGASNPLTGSEHTEVERRDVELKGVWHSVKKRSFSFLDICGGGRSAGCCLSLSLWASRLSPQGLAPESSFSDSNIWNFVIKLTREGRDKGSWHIGIWLSVSLFFLLRSWQTRGKEKFTLAGFQSRFLSWAKSLCWVFLCGETP